MYVWCCEPYVKVFHNAHDVLEDDGVINLSTHTIKVRLGRQYTLPTTDIVTSLTVGVDLGGEECWDIIVQKIGENL